MYKTIDNLELHLKINPYTDVEELISIIQKLHISGNVISKTDDIDSDNQQPKLNEIMNRKILENKFNSIGFETIDIYDRY